MGDEDGSGDGSQMQSTGMPSRSSFYDADVLDELINFVSSKGGFCYSEDLSEFYSQNVKLSTKALREAMKWKLDRAVISTNGKLIKKADDRPNAKPGSARIELLGGGNNRKNQKSNIAVLPQKLCRAYQQGVINSFSVINLNIVFFEPLPFF